MARNAKVGLASPIDRGIGVVEGRLFHSMARKWVPLSDDIRSVNFHFGEDSSGEPSVWITVVVPHDLERSRERLNALKDATENFKADVWKSGVKRWPYIKIETE